VRDKSAINYGYSDSPARRMGKAIIKFFTALITILLVLVIAICTTIWVLAKGPSPTAQRLFVMSVRETSAVGFLANIFLSEAEIERIIGVPESDAVQYETDTSLITVAAARPVVPISSNDAEVEDVEIEDTAPLDDDIEESGDGLELVEVNGNGYKGFMLIVSDPLRVFVGTPVNFGGAGVKLMDMIRRTEAVAGINAGGFYDPDGTGSGGIPDGLVICDGELKWGAGGGTVNVIGFDADGILHVGSMTSTAAMNLGLQWAVSFGPTLISNGVAQDKELVRSGINPRTAIGQRADGAVLLLVVDGRQIHSLGATYEDLIEIMLDFGAVNAANLDGGSSTLMIIDEEFVNSCASVSGPRTIPTAFLVR